MSSFASKCQHDQYNLREPRWVLIGIDTHNNGDKQDNRTFVKVNAKTVDESHFIQSRGSQDESLHPQTQSHEWMASYHTLQKLGPHSLYSNTS